MKFEPVAVAPNNALVMNTFGMAVSAVMTARNVAHLARARRMK